MLVDKQTKIMTYFNSSITTATAPDVGVDGILQASLVYHLYLLFYQLENKTINPHKMFLLEKYFYFISIMFFF